MSNTFFRPGQDARTLISPDGIPVSIPTGWALLPPGDAACTRRVKAAGDHFVVAEKKGRKVFSQGIWAPEETIRQVQAVLETERSDPRHARKKQADTARREQAQENYVNDFRLAVLTSLKFHPRYETQAQTLANLITTHATPVGSGTVARTQRIPIEERASAAIIAWMRHQTTGYDSMKIPRVKGKRREVRRMLAQRSQELLNSYRSGQPIAENCPLLNALNANSQAPESP